MIKNKVAINASWIIVCKILQSVINLIVSMLTARYLGPSQFGLINYAASIVSFVVPIMNLGINAVLVQEIVKNPKKEGELLGTSIVLNFTSAVFCIIGIAAFVSIINANEFDTLLVCILYSTLLLFQSFEVITYWFQAKYLSKYSSIITLIAYAIMSAYKVYLLVTNKNVYWFAVSNAIDYFIISIGLFYSYKRMGNQKLSFSLNRAKNLLSIGKYYIISELMVTIFAQTDRIMIKGMIGNEATGYYSAAVSCAAITSFVFLAILQSSRPAILESKVKSENSYKLNMIRLFSIIIYLSLFQSFGISILSKFIINFIYGADYQPAASALKIIVWYTTFSYLGSARNIWILAENKQKYLWQINLTGAVTNVILNYFLIPILGINGAAIASLITQIFTNIFTGLLIKEMRETVDLMYKSLNPKILLQLIKKF